MPRLTVPGGKEAFAECGGRGGGGSGGRGGRCWQPWNLPDRPGKQLQQQETEPGRRLHLLMAPCSDLFGFLPPDLSSFWRQPGRSWEDPGQSQRRP